MSLPLIVEPEAEAEILEAAVWYDERNETLRTNFLRAVERTLERIQQNPLQYQIIFGQVRRAMLGRFPYGLMYVVSEKEIIVAACSHCRRDPKRWQDRTNR